jgi:hypothetical protein
MSRQEAAEDNRKRVRPAAADCLALDPAQPPLLRQIDAEAEIDLGIAATASRFEEGDQFRALSQFRF